MQNILERNPRLFDPYQSASNQQESITGSWAVIPPPCDQERMMREQEEAHIASIHPLRSINPNKRTFVEEQIERVLLDLAQTPQRSTQRKYSSESNQVPELPGIESIIHMGRGSGIFYLKDIRRTSPEATQRVEQIIPTLFVNAYKISDQITQQYGEQGDILEFVDAFSRIVYFPTNSQEQRSYLEVAGSDKKRRQRFYKERGFSRQTGRSFTTITDRKSDLSLEFETIPTPDTHYEGYSIYDGAMPDVARETIATILQNKAKKGNTEHDIAAIITENGADRVQNHPQIRTSLISKSGLEIATFRAVPCTDINGTDIFSLYFDNFENNSTLVRFSQNHSAQQIIRDFGYGLYTANLKRTEK